MNSATTCLFVLLLSLLQLPTAQSESVEVFLVTHSHDDVGWLETIDEYYNSEVQYIISSCIEALSLNHERKYTQVEIAYFQKWWRSATAEQKQMTRDAIQRGQLEFNVGGMAMNDEATVTYHQEINQMSEGALFLLNELNVRPASVWHIDPFGHSSATASLWSQMGFNAFILNRVPYWIKDNMKLDKTLEFIWEGSASLGSYSSIFCHIMDNHYNTPVQINFDNNWDVEKVAKDFAEEAKLRRTYYRHNKLMIPYGDDFKHINGTVDFANMDRLISYVNQNEEKLGINMRYAVVSDYIKAVNSLQLKWSIFRDDDFFPYTDSPDRYWSGYYTTRPGLKAHARRSTHLLSAADVMISTEAYLHYNTTVLNDDIMSSRYATSVVTHHDGITGTSPYSTILDFERLLTVGDKQALDMISYVLSPADNHDIIDNNDDIHTYVVLNTLQWKRKEIYYILSNYSSADVFDRNGVKLLSQVNSVASYENISSKYRIYIYMEINPLAKETITVKYNNKDLEENVHDGNDIILSNDEISLSFDDVTGKVKNMKNKNQNINIDINMEYIEYLEWLNTPLGCGFSWYILTSQSDSLMIISDDNNNDIYSSTWTFSTKRSQHDYIFYTINGKGADAVIPFVHALSDTSFNATLTPTSHGSYRNGLQLDFFSGDKLPEYVPSDKYEFGHVTVKGDGISPSTIVKQKFKNTFNALPRIILSLHNDIVNINNTFVISVISINNYGFAAKISSYNNVTWDEDLEISYVALIDGKYVDVNNNLTIISSSFSAKKQQSNNNVFNVNTGIIQGNALILLTPILSGNNDNIILNVLDKHREGFSVVAKDVKNNDMSDIMFNYIILPRIPGELKVADKVRNVLKKGSLVNEVHQYWNGAYGQSLIAYQKGDMMSNIEIRNFIGKSTDVTDASLRISTNMNTDAKICTDNNGMEMITRQFNSTVRDLLGGNYYPMVQRVIMNDINTGVHMNVLSDTTHGASSMNNGEVEIMLQRICGDWEHIDPILLLSVHNQDNYHVHRHQSVLQQSPLVVVEQEYIQNSTAFQFNELPDNVHLLTSKIIYDGSLLLRLQHIYAVGESAKYSQPAKIKIGNIVRQKIKKITEVSLSGNMDIKDIDKLVWKTEGDLTPHQFIPLNGDVVVIQPMEIRSFKIEF